MWGVGYSQLELIIWAINISLQIDLIDMRHWPDGMYRWIGHYMDHWSKFHIPFPLSRKSSAEIGLNLQNKFFSILGTPQICSRTMEICERCCAQCSEGVAWWSDVNGRPRNPKYQLFSRGSNWWLSSLVRVSSNVRQHWMLF